MQNELAFDSLKLAINSLFTGVSEIVVLKVTADEALGCLEVIIRGVHTSDMLNQLVRKSANDLPVFFFEL